MHAPTGSDYLSRGLHWEASEKFAAALDFIRGETETSAQEKKIEWLVLCGDALHGRQWYEDALECYRQALSFLPLIKATSSFRPSETEIAVKIEKTINEGRNFNPHIGEELVPKLG
jgi:tetratricopeptide (TPR) repeat protein